MSAVAEKPDEKQFGRCMRIERTGDQEVRDRNPIGGFGPHWRQRRKRRRGDGVADIDVHYYCEDCIKCRREYLECVGGLEAINM